MVLHYKSLSVTADIPNLYFSWNEAFCSHFWAEKSEIHSYIQQLVAFPVVKLVFLLRGLGLCSFENLTVGGSGDMNSF